MAGVLKFLLYLTTDKYVCASVQGGSEIKRGLGGSRNRRTFSSSVFFDEFWHIERVFTCYFVWVWNLVSHTEGGTQTEGVREEGAEEDIWA
jgi:hypothetical protein